MGARSASASTSRPGIRHHLGWIVHLELPQPDGTLAPVTFTSASPSQFNAAVTSLHSQLNGANSYAAEQQQIQQEQANINGAINTVAVTSQRSPNSASLLWSSSLRRGGAGPIRSRQDRDGCSDRRGRARSNTSATTPARPTTTQESLATTMARSAISLVRSNQRSPVPAAKCRGRCRFPNHGIG